METVIVDADPPRETWVGRARFRFARRGSRFLGRNLCALCGENLEGLNPPQSGQWGRI
jgi:hypothetical protein